MCGILILKLAVNPQEASKVLMVAKISGGVFQAFLKEQESILLSCSCVFSGYRAWRSSGILSLRDDTFLL